ncbi:MAG: PKD domain-containing protein [Flavobacteriales bacterium]|nr:PKD domain-containing protein [Flavobacteriales bacterium]
MTEFENKIKESLENYSVPDATPDWSTFEQKLDATNKRKNGTGFIAAAIIGLLAGLAFVYNTDVQSTSSLANNNQTIKETASKVNVEQKNSTINNQITATTKDVATESVIETAAIQQNEIEEEIATADNIPELRLPPNRLMMNDSDPSTSANETKKGEESVPQNKPSHYIPLKASEVMVSKKVCCINEEIQFSTNDVNCSYVWDFGDGTIGYGKLPNHTYEDEGTYKVAVTITSKETRKSTYAYRADIKVSPNPIADFEYTKPNWNDCETEHQFMSINVGEPINEWYIGKNKIGDGSSLKYPLHKKGMHEITLVTENSNGCKSSNTQLVEIEKDYNLRAANAFASSLADLWMPKDLLCLNNEFNLIIITRFGEIVFQTNTIEKNWDGTILGSTQRVRAGENYAWSATYIDNNGITRQAKGLITIR